MASSGEIEQVDGYAWAEVLRLALSAGSGRVRHTGILASGCRGALFVDAVARGIVTFDDDQLQFDSSTAGAGLVADLVRECEHHPKRTLAEFLQRGRPHLSDFIAALVSTGVWQRHGLPLDADHSAYQDRDAQRYEQLRTELGAAAGGAAGAPHDVVVAALARVLNLHTGSHRSLREPAEDVIRACGPLGWIVKDVTTYLVDAQQTDLAAGRDDGLTNASQLATS